MFIQLIISVASLEVTGLVGAVLYRALDRALRAATGPPRQQLAEEGGEGVGERRGEEDMFENVFFETPRLRSQNTSFLTGTTFGKISDMLCEKSSALDKLIKSDVS